MRTPLTAGNARLKEARKLSRRSVRAERRLFLADGPKAVEGALSVEGCVVEVFATPEAAQRFAAQLSSVEVTLVDDRAMASLSDAVSPAGLVAVCRFLPAPGAAFGADSTLAVICADVRDPGNAGTVIRTADAAGAASVVLAGDSVDAYNPKTVRASVGSLFALPVSMSRSVPDSIAVAKTAGLQVIAADGSGEADLFDLDEHLRQPTAWLFGNEAWGLPQQTRDLADIVCRIPILGRAESLNLATAAAVCLYASARSQRG